MVKKTYKRNYKKSRKHTRRRSHKKSSNTLSLSNRNNMLIIPERFRTWLESTMDFYVPVGNMGSAGNYMDICVNTLNGIYNQTYTVNTSVNSYSMHGAYVNGYTSTTPPLGLGLYQQLYSLYKVLSYDLTITVQPQATGDTTELIIFPIGNEEIPSTVAGNVNGYIFKGQPFNKQKVCAPGASTKSNSLRLRQSIYKTLGKRRSQWMDIDSVNLSSSPSGQDKAFVGIFLQILDGALNSSNIVVNIKLKLHIEFTDAIAQIA